MSGRTSRSAMDQSVILFELSQVHLRRLYAAQEALDRHITQSKVVIAESLDLLRALSGVASRAPSEQPPQQPPQRLAVVLEELLEATSDGGGTQPPGAGSVLDGIDGTRLIDYGLEPMLVASSPTRPDELPVNDADARLPDVDSRRLRQR